MRQKEIFNINRFGKYLYSDLESGLRQSGMTMLLISLMGVIIYVGTFLISLLLKGETDAPSIEFRIFTGIICLIVLTMVIGAKCYGHLTEKRAGTLWLIIPASKLEKTLSMIITNIVFVFGTIIAFLLVDMLICTIDSRAGSCILKALFTIEQMIISEVPPQEYAGISSAISQISNPLLYIDDIIGFTLIFLLGAIFFKTHKTVKTIISFFIVSAIVGSAVSPFILQMTKESVEMISTIQSPVDQLNALSDLWIVKHIALFDTINDTVVNILLVICIYFRITTLKH